ncbi:MAG: ABC transporter permease subunit [Alphaproteobacteria bacterium]|nr:ABC transporter permease subunit [Alphaproteobacteria bacterium]
MRQSPVFSLGKLRRPLAMAIGCVMLILTIVPLGSLCYKAGVVGAKIDGVFTRSWSLDKFMTMVLGSPTRFADEFWWSFELGVLAATGAVIAAVPLAWIARGGGRRAAPTLCITAVALALPGPLVAMVLIWLLNRRESALLVLLYDRTLLAPWLALLVRTVPWATLILWFAFRSLATDVLDSAASEGAGPLTRLFRIALPQRLAALATAWLVTFAIALGDLSATVLVLPPGAETLSVRIFRLIHSAADDQVAGVCLALLGILAVLTAAALGCVRRLR